MIFFRKANKIANLEDKVEELQKRITSLKKLLNDKGVLDWCEVSRWTVFAGDSIDLFELRRRVSALYEYFKLEKVIEPEKTYLKEKKGSKKGDK